MYLAWGTAQPAATDRASKYFVVEPKNVQKLERRVTIEGRVWAAALAAQFVSRLSLCSLAPLPLSELPFGLVRVRVRAHREEAEVEREAHDDDVKQRAAGQVDGHEGVEQNEDHGRR